ncbi:M20 family metallopeptidase [Alloyangia pacifica]|uniref:M20 family metallopeptidase n=1 Tax=Alloyangia pacifica TaxID=311180 RepID=UPI001CFF1A2C|nr:M20 family metallopeptidase [Alloyangia pacifica]
MTQHPDLSDVAALTRKLVGFDTINPPGREADAMRYCAGLLESIGFACRMVPHGPERCSLIAQRGPEGGLAFSGHLDTVPLGRAPWTRPPHGGEIEGDRLYGRGSSDMKGGIAAFLVAAARSTSATGTGVILTVGEETGCDGARWLAEAGELPKVDALVVGESTDNQPLAGHKGALWLKLIAEGRTAHGATPELGINAIAALSPTLARLCAYQPETLHPQMGRATCNLGTLHAGININSVPDLCELTVDLRSVEGVSHAELTAAVASCCDADVRIETLLDLPAVWTDPSDPWFARAAETARAVTGREVSLACATYFTDASTLKPALGAPPVMILGPGSMDQPHGTDEYVRLSRLAEAVEIYAALIASAG